MFLEILKEIGKAMKIVFEIATDPDTALWFWGIMAATFIILLII